MHTWLRKLPTAALAFATAMAWVGGAFAAEPGDPVAIDDALKYMVGLGSVVVLALLLLSLRFRRVRAPDGVDAAHEDEPRGPATPPSDSPEAHLPRWRRPSVVADRLGMARPAEQRGDRQTFDGEEPGTERMVIRYDAVPMVDEPDDVHGRLVDELSAGDEVQILQRDAVWVRVRTPAGRDGWVPAMTVASHDEVPDRWAEDVVPAAEEPEPRDGPPLEDLLAAIVEQRRREAEPTAADVPAPKRSRTSRVPTRRKAAGAGS
jgi:hypothetical protein